MRPRCGRDAAERRPRGGREAAEAIGGRLGSERPSAVASLVPVPAGESYPNAFAEAEVGVRACLEPAEGQPGVMQQKYELVRASPRRAAPER